ncbi:unnamed protein product, partial [Ectocarpus sp. 12 AP-2014]
AFGYSCVDPNGGTCPPSYCEDFDSDVTPATDAPVTPPTDPVTPSPVTPATD